MNLILKICGMAAKKREPTEFDLLSIFVREMESHGVSHKLIRIDIDDALVAQMGAFLFIKVSLEEMQRLADKCFANEWLEHAYMGAQYGGLQLTTSGFGVVRSKQRKQESLAKRSIAKKTSDYVEDHKGLVIVLGILIGAAGLFIRGIGK